MFARNRVGRLSSVCSTTGPISRGGRSPGRASCFLEVEGCIVLNAVDVYETSGIDGQRFLLPVRRRRGEPYLSTLSVPHRTWPQSTAPCTERSLTVAQVVVMTRAYGERKGVRYLTRGLKVYYLPRYGVLSGSAFPNVFGNMCLLRVILIREQISIVHGHQSSSALACQTILQARALGYKCVFTDHSLFGFADLSGISLNKTLKFVLADVHHVICVSHTSKQNTVIRACLPPSRVSVIPNAVDSSDFEPETTKELNPERITIVAFTRLVYRKGIDLLAVILPEICARHAHVFFRICASRVVGCLSVRALGGDGPKKKLLEELISREDLQERVMLLPGVPHSEARNVLTQGDIFVNASLTEAFCIAIVEAASAGLLVVSTRVGGVPEVLPRDMVVLAEPTPDSLVDAIEEALRRVHHVDRITQHRRVAEMYSWWRVAEKTEAVYHTVHHDRRDDSALAQLERHAQCGRIAGVIFAFLAMALRLVAALLAWWKPEASIERALDST